MTSSVSKSKQIIGEHFKTLFSKIVVFLPFLNSKTDFIILKTDYKQFTLTTKKSLHVIFNNCGLKKIHQKYFGHFVINATSIEDEDTEREC